MSVDRLKRGTDDAFGPRYRLLRRLWNDGPHGGWLALDQDLDRKVVLNVPYPAVDHEVFLRRARTWGRLRHPGLIPLYDLAAAADGQPYYVVAYVEGPSLCDLARHGADARVTLAALVRHLLGACRALHYLHGKGLLHLALSPRDVLVCRESGEASLIRGLAAVPPFADREPGDLDCSCDGAFNPAYAAPEQAGLGRPSVPDASCDVYGAGGLLFELLYDHPPNMPPTGGRGRPPEILQALVSRAGPPEPGPLGVRAARQHVVAEALEPICLRALEADPTDRHPSVAAFAEEVEHALYRASA